LSLKRGRTVSELTFRTCPVASPSQKAASKSSRSSKKPSNSILKAPAEYDFPTDEELRLAADAIFLELEDRD
jgi:hypothetical protein